VDSGAVPVGLRRRTPTARVAVVIAIAALAGVGAGVAAHVFLSRQATAPVALPDLHGQATWAAGARRAPGFTLRDVLGGRVSLASARGHVVLITFLDSRCRTLCPLIGRAIGDVQRSLPAAARPVVLVVSVDPRGDTRSSVRAAARRWSLAPGWHWLSGSRQQLAGVWRSYGIAVQRTTNDIVHGAAVYLVDRRGNERAGYLAPLLPNFLALDVRRVARESS
jgi:cytochrome oxidase Cu insertion factor (SCO1/SenC/PrrC family)